MLRTIWTWTHEWSDIDKALGVELRHVPPAADLGVGVDPVEERLELAVAAGRRLDVSALDRLERPHAALARPGGLARPPRSISTSDGSSLMRGVCHSHPRPTLKGV